MKSKHKRKSSSQTLLRKPQLSHQGVMFHEVPVPVSPASKKRAAEDMAKHLSQPKKKKTKKAQKIVLSSESTEEDERVPETPEVTSILTSSIPETTVIFTPEVSIAKSRSIFEEVRTSNLSENFSKDAAQGLFIFTPFETFVSIPPTSTIPPTSATISPTFEHILNQPITSMFSSQSTDTAKPTSPTETDHEGFRGTFEDLEFQDEEEDFPNHMLITMKQYKILNQKLNSIIHSQADLGGGSSISSLEVDSMLKMCESRIIAKVSRMLKASETVLMEKEVKKVREDVNSKIQELHEEMNKEILSFQHDYASLHQKVNIICDVVTKFVKMYEGLSPQIAQISKPETENFKGVMKLLKELKEISTKPVSSPLITPKFLSQKFVQFEAILNKQLAPLFHISSLLPTTTAPPVFTGVQGGERKSTEEEAKVMGKIIFTSVFKSRILTLNSNCNSFYIRFFDSSVFCLARKPRDPRPPPSGGGYRHVPPPATTRNNGNETPNHRHRVVTVASCRHRPPRWVVVCLIVFGWHLECLDSIGLENLTTTVRWWPLSCATVDHHYPRW
ncbi:unnamed protein product [Lactuca saligna]|uniref:Uncharacterized protein n=1 Tax=Lactuca saligna TaxID=75948 RepID=A0AA35YCK0_LACSI|nr:unnamed protein product [Lactuca saligna]